MYYRVYLVDHLGHIVSGIDCEYESDKAAAAFAAAIVWSGGSVELWQSARFVATFARELVSS
jgi:hypothetical protein